MEILGPGAGRLSVQAQRDPSHGGESTGVGEEVRSVLARTRVERPTPLGQGSEAQGEARSMPRGIALQKTGAPMPVETMSSQSLLMLRGLNEPDALPSNILQSAVSRAPETDTGLPDRIRIEVPLPDLEPRGPESEALGQRPAAGQAGFERVVAEAAVTLADQVRQHMETLAQSKGPPKPRSVTLSPLGDSGPEPRRGATPGMDGPLTTVREQLRAAAEKLARPVLEDPAVHRLPAFGAQLPGPTQRPQAMVQNPSGTVELKPLHDLRRGFQDFVNETTSARDTSASAAPVLDTKVSPLTGNRPPSVTERLVQNGLTSGSATEPATTGGFEPLTMRSSTAFMLGNNAAPFVADRSLSSADVARQAFVRGVVNTPGSEEV